MRWGKKRNKGHPWGAYTINCYARWVRKIAITDWADTCYPTHCSAAPTPALSALLQNSISSPLRGNLRNCYEFDRTWKRNVALTLSILVLCAGGFFGFILFSLFFTYQHYRPLPETRPQTQGKFLPVGQALEWEGCSLDSQTHKGITHITHPWHQIPPGSIRTTALRVGWDLSKVRLGEEVNKNPKRTILGQLVVLLILQEDFSCFL